MTTPLSAYMERNKIGDAEFGVLIGKDRSLVNRLRRGEVRPTLEVAGLIEAKTKGEIPMQAWVSGLADADAEVPAQDAAA